MMPSNFEKTFSNYYNGKKLSSSQLTELLRVQEMVKQSKRGLLLRSTLGGAFFTLLFFSLYTYMNTDIRKDISGEVVKNHLKKMPPEVLSGDISVINQSLDRLDFKVRNSDYIKNNFVIIGARYCEIGGQIAAQIKLKKNDTGFYYTLYQYREKRFGQTDFNKPENSYLNHISIRLWREGDLFFALAGPR